jgi:hypothetical protein
VPLVEEQGLFWLGRWYSRRLWSANARSAGRYRFLFQKVFGYVEYDQLGAVDDWGDIIHGTKNISRDVKVGEIGYKSNTIQALYDI